MDVEEDLLSLLPDCLILEIISRLPYTKEVIRTGILSKRWKHLWTQVPNLVFHRSYEYNENKDSQSLIDYYSYVDKTLTQCRHSNLNKFKLNTRYDIQFESQVNKWIRYALKCNVQELDLLLKIPGYEGGFVLDSESFFINSCFTKLKLFDCQFNPSGTISWKNLRYLSITYGKLNEGLIQNILTGSPVLETFKLKRCYGFSRMDITSKSLKNLVFSGYCNRKSRYDIIEINAPNIWSLTVRKWLALSNLLLVNVSCLVKAKLDYTISKDNDTTHEQVEEEMLKGFIQKLCHIKELTIGDSCQKVITRLQAKGLSLPSNIKYLGIP